MQNGQDVLSLQKALPVKNSCYTYLMLIMTLRSGALTCEDLQQCHGDVDPRHVIVPSQYEASVGDVLTIVMVVALILAYLLIGGLACIVYMQQRRISARKHRFATRSQLMLIDCFCFDRFMRNSSASLPVT